MASGSLLTTLLAITFAQWALYAVFLDPDYNIDNNMPRRALTDEELYARAVERCRREQKFFFLDLPIPVRRRIYSYLFNDPVFYSCSFNKDRSLSARDDWPEGARAQILCACKAIWKEALKPMYWHTNWQFSTASALQYFTWHDVLPTKLACVAKITLTNTDVVEMFANVSHRLNNLRILVIDLQPQVQLNRHAPLPVSQHDPFARRVKKTQVYLTTIRPYTEDTIAPRCCLYVVVELVCTLPSGRVTHEMIAVNVDTETVYRNYRPVDEELALEYLELPSAGDPDVIQD